MEKIQSLLWILLAVGAFVFRMVKRMQATSAQESRSRPPRPGGAVPSLPTATFQEMLQQMQARNAAAPGSETQLAPAPATPQSAPKRTLGGRPMPREVARPIRSQERPAARPASLEAPATARTLNAPAPPARRASGLARASTKAPIADAWQSVARPAAPLNETVRQWLRQPESVRAVLVLSEILQRRYE